MPKTVGRLTALKVSRDLPAGMHADGAGLYLHVSGSGAKSWIYRYSLRRKPREMGLGPLSALGVADARIKAAECRALCKEGLDPIEIRKAREAQAILEAAKTITFKQAAEQYIDAKRPEWKNAKHASQWANTLSTYAYPVIGVVSVQDVDTALIQKVLDPIWLTKTETANRVRGRIERILDWATRRGLRIGANPARWRGHLEFDLAKRSKVRPVRHHAALPYAELPDFMAALRAQEGVAAQALEFTILSTSRTSETLGVAPDEINATQKVWTVPGERMKAGKEHRVPLSARALAIVRNVTSLQTGDDTFVFRGGKQGKPLSNMAMAAVLKRMGREDITVHGFRSTFRDWAAELTNYPNEVVEMALAHTVSDKVEAAYRRGDLFDKRRRLMADWAAYCNTPKSATRGIVIPMRKV